MTTSTSKSRIILFIPPALRFIVELATWVWLIFAGFRYTIFWVLLPISVGSLALLNFPGDKKPKSQRVTGIAVKGWIRVLIEISSAILGISAAFIATIPFYYGIVSGIPQLIVTIILFLLDGRRLLWMLGRRPEPPLYVKVAHQNSDYESGNNLSNP